MPMYNYECECGNTDWDIRTIAKRNDEFICSACGGRMVKSVSCAHVRGDYSHKIVSDSMAMAIDQIPEHKQKFPDIRVTPEGQPVFENFNAHEAYLKETGFVKHPGKTKIKAVTSDK